MASGSKEMGVAYGCTRHSSEDQGKGSTLPRQQAKIEGWCSNAGLRIAEWIHDDGVSADGGHNLHHGKIAKLRQDIIDGRKPPGDLVHEEPDRLSRAGNWPTMEFVAPLINRGCRFVFVDQNVIVQKTEDDDELLAIMRTLFGVHGSKRENDKRKGRVKGEAALRREKLKKGTYYSARTPDWLVVPPVQGKGQHDREATFRSPEHEAFIPWAFEMRSKGYGPVRLAAWLNARTNDDPMYRPWRGGSWTADMLSNLLSNRAVLGEYQPCRSVPSDPPRYTARASTRVGRRSVTGWLAEPTWRDLQ
jgi:DNA invertase Pin-like site-specific DNA recombinase